MKNKLSKILVILFSISCILTAFNYTANADTDGTEMKILQAQQLEVQLGTAWAGVEFQLRTDAGLYPGTVKVGDDGVLRMEIGGSKSYILTCMNSAVEVPEVTQAPATTETESERNNSETDSAEDGSATVAGIPVLHIVLFAGGMVVAIGALIAMHVVKRRRESEPAYDDDDDE